MKVFISNSVRLSRVPSEHRASNGNCQYTTMVRAKTKKRVAQILGCSDHILRTFYGCMPTDNPEKIAVVKKDETIYYHIGHTKNGYVDKWAEYIISS